MKFMLLIHQGSTPTPPSEEWTALGGREGRDLRCLQGDRRDARRQPGPPAAASGVGNHGAREGRQDADHRRPVRRDQGDDRGYLLFESEDAGAAVELATRIPAARLGGAIEVRPIVEW